MASVPEDSINALAVRCWRDLDAATVATDLALRDRARTQYDAALLDGLAEIVATRFEAYEAASGVERAYQRAFLETLAPALDREMTVRSTADAMALREEVSNLATDAANVARATGAIRSAFACP